MDASQDRCYVDPSPVEAGLPDKADAYVARVKARVARGGHDIPKGRERSLRRGGCASDAFVPVV